MFPKPVNNNEEKALIQIALHSCDISKRMAAVQEINDEDTLFEVALYDKDPKAHSDAKLISDMMNMFADLL